MKPSKVEKAKMRSASIPPKSVIHAKNHSQGEQESIEKVREILFGRKLQEQDKHFSVLESKIDSEIKMLKREYKDRLDELENLFLNEVKSLTEKMKVERKSWEEMTDKLGGRVSELRSLVLKKNKKLTNDIHSENERLQKILKEEFSSLEEKKVSKSDVIEFLNDWAIRLNSGNFARSEHRLEN